MVETSKALVLENDVKLRTFVQEVTETLIAGRRHESPGLGTFSICVRKATPKRAACKIAMFRASAELREFASGGPKPRVSGPHAEVVSSIAEAMCSKGGVEVPSLGLMAAVPVPGKKPKLVFHGAPELNDLLTITPERK